MNLTVQRSLIRRIELTIFIGKLSLKTEQLQHTYNYKITTKQQPVGLGHQPEHTQHFGRSDWGIETSIINSNWSD